MHGEGQEEQDGLDKIALTLRDAVNDIFSQKGDIPEKVTSAVHFSHHWFRTLREGIRTAGQVACAKGCAWCCTQRVALNPAEAFAIAWFMEDADFPAELRKNVAAECRRVWDHEDRLDSAERYATGLPCPFLDRETPACLIYPVRPLSCRWYESMDDTACRTATAEAGGTLDIPLDPRIEPLARIVEQGLYQGLFPQGMRFNNSLIMTGALAIIWDDPTALARWCAGEDPFAQVRVERVGKPLRDFHR
ncbi:MAG: YkgJ family cysteine cluster protein [Magnetococcales bacterium]|nr:YkgJ family cysteine cluster protein [Magnetococcales bacterium]